MPKTLLQTIKDDFEPKTLFLLSDIRAKGFTPAAEKEELLRLTKKGSVKRFGYGIYYLPDPSDKTPPSILEAIEIRYFKNEEQVIGFYTGHNFLELLRGQKLTIDEPLEIMTNKATSGKKTIFVFGKRLTIRKPYFTIDKKNQYLNSFLSYVSLAPLDEIRVNYSLLANFVRANQLNADDVMKMASQFPAKTSSKLLATNLYRSLWKH